MTDLFDPDDEDWAAYQQQSPDYYLRVAGDAIRRYLGWHLSPSLTQTVEVPVKQKGLLPLPSRYVTGITSIEIDERVIEPSDYDWDEGGWIQTGLYYYDTPRWSPATSSWLPNLATVTFTHGYAETPLTVKQVAYELVESTIATPIGNVSQMATPAGYRIQLSSPSGFYLSDGQRQLLAPYRLHGVA